MILRYQKFLESNSMIPSVGEVKEYFTEILQVFDFEKRCYTNCYNH